MGQSSGAQLEPSMGKRAARAKHQVEPVDRKLLKRHIRSERGSGQTEVTGSQLRTKCRMRQPWEMVGDRTHGILRFLDQVSSRSFVLNRLSKNLHVL